MPGNHIPCSQDGSLEAPSWASHEKQEYPICLLRVGGGPTPTTLSKKPPSPGFFIVSSFRPFSVGWLRPALVFVTLWLVLLRHLGMWEHLPHICFCHVFVSLDLRQKCDRKIRVLISCFINTLTTKKKIPGEERMKITYLIHRNVKSKITCQKSYTNLKVK